MIRKNKFLVAVSLFVFAIGVLVAWSSRTSAFGYSAYPTNCISRQGNVSCRKKGGDMFIYTSRTGYYGHSGRLGSRGNRSFHGGGVRGGK